MSLGSFLFGSKPKTEQVDALTPEQQDLLSDLINRVLSGSQGFGFDEDFFQQSFTDPAMQEFEQRIAPSIQQKAIGGGFGGATSGIGSQLAQAGSQLAGTLAGQRADLLNQALNRQLQASGLALGTKPFGLQQTPGSTGFLSAALPAAGAALGGAFGGPAGAKLGGGLGSASAQGFRGFRR